jgi:hypothetical protein
MKTFKIAQLVAVVALFVVVGSASAFGRCCKSRCEKTYEQSCVRTCATCPTVKIPTEEVEYQRIIKESCGNPGSVKYYVRKEYIPCTLEEKEHVQTLKGCPKYLGTFDENGDRIG